MRTLVARLLFALAIFTPVAVVSGLVSLYLRMSAINNSTEVAQESTGHNYPISAQIFASPKLIVYVTRDYYIAWLASEAIFFAWLASIVCISIVAEILGFGRQAK
jgi:heme/copper-type cytochrome/quinol oxidase subunit 2